MPAESSKAVTECVGKVVEEMGQIDIVIANAGICIHRDAQVGPSPSLFICAEFARGKVNIDGLNFNRI